MLSTVRQLLKTKGNAALSIDASRPVREALIQMIDNNVGSLLVRRNGAVVGLFTERSFVRKGAVAKGFSIDSPVADVMVEEVLYVSPDTTIEQCMALMTDTRTRHLPVLENESLVGIVSIGDLVKKLLGDKDFAIEQLERYISGR